MNKKICAGMIALMAMTMAFSSIAVADEPIAETDLGIVQVNGGFFGITWGVKNIGMVTARNVVTSVEICGGILNMVNVSHMCDGGCGNCSRDVEPDMIKYEGSMEGGIVLGIGPVDVTITADADNANLVTVYAKGLVIGPYVMVF